MKLTERQKRFVDYYLEFGNAKKAAVKAGYSERTARFIGAENLTKPKVNAYLKLRLDEIESARIAQSVEVLVYLTSVMRGESNSEIVIVEGTGEGCSEAKHLQKAPDEKERLKAAELLGKRYRMFTDNVNLEGGFQIQFSGEENLPD